MKRSKLSYDKWDCIVSKDLKGRNINTDFFKGHVEFISINKVNEKQTWRFNGEDIVICDKGIKWLTILPQDDFYCITAKLNEKDQIQLWYIDMIAGQGVDSEGVPYFDDLYLDLVVYPDGSVLEDDMDELEEALSKKDITQEQFNLAIDTSNNLKEGILSNIDDFVRFTEKCYEMVKR